MSKGQHLTRYQQGIVRRYYQNIDALSLQKLSEIVSDLAVCTDDRAAAKLWTRAAQALTKAGVEPDQIARLTASKDVRALADAVGKLAK